jgi:hypothetical protein
LLETMDGETYSLRCLQVDRVREGVSGGIITQGTTIMVRSTMSGQPILRIVTEIDERYSNLVTRFTQLCAAVLDVPRLSMHLQWKPPVPLHLDVDCDCYQLARYGPLLLEATALITPITEKQYTDFARVQSDRDYCVVCCDPAEDLNNYSRARNENCVRCTPCSLCDKCNVTIVGERVCLCCIESAEEDLLGSVARRRKLLVDYDDEIDFASSSSE